VKKRLFGRGIIIRINVGIHSKTFGFLEINASLFSILAFKKEVITLISTKAG
jgi:hypothetical protein